MQAWRLGSYELMRRLGEGGMAQVYLARDVRLGRDVAIKVLDSRLAERPGFRERFLREARVAAALDHPNIVSLYDFGESERLLYLVMPYVSGGSLQDKLRRAPFPVGEVATYGSQIADALDYAHQRSVVHRDVKPANMLLHADGRVLLSDFGLAKILNNSSRPAAPRGHPDAGTPEYMAPEQIEGRSDERSDIYALGVVLYLLLTGRLPFTGSTSSSVMESHLYRLPEQPRTLNTAVTPAMEAVVLRALAKHPDDRYQRASELGGALLGALIAGDAEPLPFTLSTSQPPVSTAPVSLHTSPHAPSSDWAGWEPPLVASGSGAAMPLSGAVADVLPRLDEHLTAGTSRQPVVTGGPFSPAAPISQIGRMAIPSHGPTPLMPVDSPAFAQQPVRAGGASFPGITKPASLSRPPTARMPRRLPTVLRQRLWIVIAVLLMVALLLAGLLLRWLQDQPAALPAHSFRNVAPIATTTYGGSHLPRVRAVQRGDGTILWTPVAPR